MKTPSFNELQTLVEYFSDELLGSQLQEIQSTNEGLVLVFYRFNHEPKTAYVVFDLDIQFPFMGLYFSNPWPHLKKIKPLGLFLNSHGKNLALSQIRLLPNYGRVLQIELGKAGEGFTPTRLEFRMIPKQANLIVTKDKKSISWYPVKPLTEMAVPVSDGPNEIEDVRSIPFILKSWFERRGAGKKQIEKTMTVGQSPFDKWKAQRQKDLSKKTKAISAIEKQIQDYIDIPWSEIGDHLKSFGTKDLRPEWHQYLDFKISVSQNIQNCFAKSKAAKVKILGAQKRLALVQSEIDRLSDLSPELFESQLVERNRKQSQTKKSNRVVEGRFRKLVLDGSGLTCYMGKSAKDNLDLLRRSKAWDMWMHLKDYPSAHAIIHRQKDQNITPSDLKKVAEWLVRENFKDRIQGTRYAVVYVECRHVRPIKGDKLGRVTYHEGREILIAL